MLSPQRLVVLLMVFLIGWAVVSSPAPEPRVQADEATTDDGCGADLKNTIDRLLKDTEACIKELTGQDTEEADAWARAYFLHDQGKWSVAGEPNHDPLASNYAASPITNGATSEATVEVLRADGTLAWTTTVPHGELAVLVVDFADYDDTDTVRVTGADGQVVEVRL